MPMRRSSYRKPLTAEGIEKMEKGTLDYFDETAWSNLNTGTLEQYYNEKTRTEGFERSEWVWKHVAVGIIIGLMFALINQYVGLKVGRIVSGAWYVAYLVGLSMKWRPTEVNIVAGTATGAAATCTGFVFSYPAIYLLAYSDQYPHLVAESAIPPMYVAVCATILGGMIGVLYFTIFRRVWLVEDPLPVPGIEASVKLVDLANDISSGASEHARRTLKVVLSWASAAAIFTFFRDFKLLENTKPYLFKGDRISIMDKVFGGRFYAKGELHAPYGEYTAVGLNFVPIQLAIGWFMRFRTALLISSGTMFTWFVIVPLAVGLNLPVYDPEVNVFYSLSTLGIDGANYTYSNVAAFVAYKRVARIIAVGTILGGGMTALFKMRAVFKTAMADIPGLGKKKKSSEPDTAFVPGKGWFEWPLGHIVIMMVLVPIGITTIFYIGGFPLIPSATFGVLLTVVTFFLGAIGVKTMGETGSTPVSGTSFIVLLLLMGAFGLLTFAGFMSKAQLIVMSIFGAAIFGSALSLSSDIIGDFKTGIYAGTRPYHLVKGEMTGLVLGSTVAVVGASLFSMGLATGELDLAAPQAHAFATLVMSLMGGPNVTMLLTFLGIGALIGVVAEVTTGMGTAFGLGMYIPLPVNIPLLFGGYLRDWWTKNKLDPQAEREGWDEQKKTMANVDKYMAMTGMIIGEAIMGTVVAFILIATLF